MENKILKKNYTAIDVGRIVCSILVMMIHIPPLGSSLNVVTTEVDFWIRNYVARLAVPYFFITSG